MIKVLYDSHLGNLSILIFLALGIYYSICALLRCDGHTRILSKDSRGMVQAHIIMWIGLSLGYGYWLFGSNTGLDSIWHEYKGIMRLVTAGLFGWGMVKFLNIFEGWSPRSKLVHFLGAFVLAYIGTTVFW